ncbi:hypothetical protein SFUMM280S_00154 [Streptomyces fumanus]
MSAVARAHAMTPGAGRRLPYTVGTGSGAGTVDSSDITHASLSCSARQERQPRRSAAKTAYAGVNPNSTNSDTGVEYTTVIVSVSQDDPNPISLKVPNVVVDKPIVTNWHTDPADAVPFTS